MRPGAIVADGRINFRVWAPTCERAHLVIDGRDDGERIEMAPRNGGWHELSLPGEPDGLRYGFALDGGRTLPDPASRWQPEGVHGPSAVVAPMPLLDPAWRGRPLHEYVVSEVHVGTFTEEGTFDAAAEHLDALVDVGITAVEVMPVAQFPGTRNWGYDGVFPYAVQHSYGGPHAFRRFVDAAHALGLCVVLDVVYNHLGPEGNVLRAYGPYFTERYHTPWGDALNFDGPDSDSVRAFFVDNALQWLDEFGVDALRLDAVHEIADTSPYPFVEQVTDAVHGLSRSTGRHVYTIAESASNDARLITETAHGGLGCDAQWSDDFHHALHAMLTGERFEYYVDYGRVADLAAAWRDGFAYEGQYSRFRRRRHGRSAAGLPAERFVVFAQNHDHIGNRAQGERLSVLVDVDALRVAAAAVICAPFLPLLFMGEEYGETAPFPYFTSHTDPQLARAVRRGRAVEFAQSVGANDVPDPQDPATFRRAILDRREREKEPHAALLAWHRTLLALRRDVPLLGPVAAHTTTEVDETARTLAVHRHTERDDDAVIVLLTFGAGDDDVAARASLGDARWETLLDSHPGAAPAVVESTEPVLQRPARSALVLRRLA
jgi:maltooligosyltrehalose trehalohydrolase